MAVNPIKKLLLFAYFYPPLGGPAVQRPCKTAKYLTQLGWEVDVVTIRDIVYHSNDDSLLSECTHKRIFRTVSIDPLYLMSMFKKLFRFNAHKLYLNASSSGKSFIKRLFPIDEKIGWLPFAYQAGKEAVLTNRYKAVMVTCSPFSAILPAYLIARKARLPLIIDYRDHWTLSSYTVNPQGFLNKLHQKLERYLLNYASLILTATNTMKQDLAAHLGKQLSDKIIPFYNGWDEADFLGMESSRIPDNIIRIAYLGTLYSGRTLEFFFKALKQMKDNDSFNNFEFWLVGNFCQDSLLEIENSGIKDKVVMMSQKIHSAAIQIMLESDILLLIIGDEKNKWMLTGKLFEYLRCQKPILAFTYEQSEAADILRSCGHQAICDINDTDDIKENLIRLVKTLKEGTFSFKIPIEYERSNQVTILSERITCL